MISITLGNRKSFGIDNKRHMVIYDDVTIPHTEVDLGPATDSNMTQLVGYIEQLRIHCDYNEWSLFPQ